MDNYICKICNQKIDAENHFWRLHGIKQIDYYLKYEPRFSKETGEPIKFKSKEFYFNNDFNTRTELLNWLNENITDGRYYAKMLLIKRKSQNKIIFAPTQVELKTIIAPSMEWYFANFDSYKKLCNQIGLKTRFLNETFNLQFNELKNTMILCDTREQKLINWNCKTKITTLPYADYRLDDKNHQGIFIEKKSLNDFCSSFGRDYNRLEREFIKANKNKDYIIIMVEATLNEVNSINYLPQTRWIKASPEFILHNCRKLLQKYKNIQFLFINKNESSDIGFKIFSLGKIVKNIDLQYLYDTKQL